MILELAESHVASLIQITEQVLKNIENKAFFNWCSVSLEQEARLSKGLVQIIDQQVTGFILFRETLDAVEVMVLATNPARQRAGAMTALVEELQKYAAQHRKPILLEVHAENKPAFTLYSKLGFKQQSFRKNYYQDGGSAVLFKWAALST